MEQSVGGRIQARCVAALDFGTTYSSYAFSFSDTPTRLHTERCWVAGSMGLLSSKTSSCVLLDPSEEFVAFGFEAENQYASLAEDRKQAGWFLFRNFKMTLHKDVKLNRSTLLREVGGKQLPAFKVFIAAIEFLKNYVIEMVKKEQPLYNTDNITFVLTIPAIWDDKAKMFMRAAALEAGIDEDKLLLALEPEAASIWCRSMEDETHTLSWSPGTNFMVVDIGGGTADITVHELDQDGRLKETHMASGGPWGGTEVDKEFEKFLIALMGKKVMDQLLAQEVGDFLDIFRDFESQKRALNSSSTQPVIIRIPASLKRFYDAHKKEATKQSRTKVKGAGPAAGDPDWCFSEGKVSMTADKLKISPHILIKLFNGPISAIVSHVRTLLDKPKLAKVDRIMLVGGFSECSLVQDAFKKAFPAKVIMNPIECGLAVLKGAVLYGHKPDTVSLRIARFTYGRSLAIPFDNKVHPISKMYVAQDGIAYCRDVFCKAVEVGQELPTGHCVTEEGRPVDDDQTSIVYQICRSSNPNPRFVTDTDCQLLGEIEMPIPEGATQEDKMVIQMMTFSDTEVKFKVKHPKTGEVYQASWDVL